MRLYVLADFIAVLLRHDDVREDDVGPHFTELGYGLGAVVHGRHFVVTVRERQLDDFLNRDAVIREEDLLRHSIAPIVSKNCSRSQEDAPHFAEGCGADGK